MMMRRRPLWLPLLLALLLVFLCTLPHPAAAQNSETDVFQEEESEASTPPLPRCLSGPTFELCQPNGLTRDTAAPLVPGAQTNAQFYAIRDELWYTFTLDVATVDLQLWWYARTVNPYLETAVFRQASRNESNNTTTTTSTSTTARPYFFRPSDRETTRSDDNQKVNVYSLGAQPAATFVVRVTVIDEAAFVVVGDDAGEPAASLSSVLLTLDYKAPPIDERTGDLQGNSPVCGENCVALCQPWGGILPQQQGRCATENDGDVVANPNVPCTCPCVDLVVGDATGSASCFAAENEALANDDNDDDDKALEVGGWIAIGISAALLICCVIACTLLTMYNRQGEEESANDNDDQKKKSRDLDPTEVNLTERHTDNDDEDLEQERPKAAARMMPAQRQQYAANAKQMWNRLLTLDDPGAQLVYTKVKPIASTGAVLVKRKFRVPTISAETGSATYTHKRFKVLFPDVPTAAHHGFVVNTTMNHGREDPLEMTESESEAENHPIRQVPSILTSGSAAKKRRNGGKKRVSSGKAELQDYGYEADGHDDDNDDDDDTQFMDDDYYLQQFSSATQRTIDKIVQEAKTKAVDIAMQPSKSSFDSALLSRSSSFKRTLPPPVEPPAHDMTPPVHHHAPNNESNKPQSTFTAPDYMGGQRPNLQKYSDKDHNRASAESKNGNKEQSSSSLDTSTVAETWAAAFVDKNSPNSSNTGGKKKKSSSTTSSSKKTTTRPLAPPAHDTVKHGRKVALSSYQPPAPLFQETTSSSKLDSETPGETTIKDDDDVHKTVAGASSTMIPSGSNHDDKKKRKKKKKKKTPLLSSATMDKPESAVSRAE